ncbi:MAG: hypothetical protein H7Y42_08180 [Chitinophagaceae bacterium]|nr:hypothetical protein [Chitinophagaceae bacterium]
MTKKLLPLIVIFLASACTNKDNAPDVSDVKVILGVQRFDKDFFAIDTVSIERDIPALQVKYPSLLPLFLQTIVGVQNATGVKDFYARYKPVYDSSAKLYNDFDPVRRQIEKGFKYAKYYFPTYQLPSNIVTVVGPMNSREDLARMRNGDYTPDFMGPDFIGVSLQFYLGKDFSLYQHQYFVNNVAPLYISRRFGKEYIVADVLKLVAEDIFPDNSKGRPLIEQMIEKGKQWWLLDKFLPGEPDSVKTGYTASQLEWCENNEGLIWSYIIKNEDLYSVNPVTLQTYIGDSPFTPVFPQENSPGNIGQWIGWQIVKKFEEKNGSMKTTDIMTAAPVKILEGAKYKPK